MFVYYSYDAESYDALPFLTSIVGAALHGAALARRRGDERHDGGRGERRPSARDLRGRVPAAGGPTILATAPHSAAFPARAPAPRGRCAGRPALPGSVR